jgi:hypothetical protein
LTQLALTRQLVIAPSRQLVALFQVVLKLPEVWQSTALAPPVQA